MGAEAHHLLGGIRISANGLALWVEAFQHAHGLKEVKPIPLLEEDCSTGGSVLRLWAAIVLKAPHVVG